MELYVCGYMAGWFIAKELQGDRFIHAGHCLKGRDVKSERQRETFLAIMILHSVCRRENVCFFSYL